MMTTTLAFFFLISPSLLPLKLAIIFNRLKAANKQEEEEEIGHTSKSIIESNRNTPFNS